MYVAMPTIAAVFQTNCLSFENLSTRRFPLLWWLNVQLRAMHEKGKLNGNTEWPYPAEKKQAQQFILSVITCKAKSIFSRQNTAHTIPAVQLYKSNAIIGQLPMSTFLHELQEKTDIVWSFFFYSSLIVTFKTID